MALTFPPKTDGRPWYQHARISLGNQIMIERVMAFDSNYQAGGLSFPFKLLVLRQVDHLDIDPQPGYFFEYDYITNKVKVFVETGGGGGGGVTIDPASAGTPAGTVSQPIFNGDPLGNHNHSINGASLFIDPASAGTPAGTVSQPTFTGNALGTHNHPIDGSALSVNSTSAGTPVGTVSAPTFTGSPLGNHLHLTNFSEVDFPVVVGNSVTLPELNVSIIQFVYVYAGATIGYYQQIPLFIGLASTRYLFDFSTGVINFFPADAVTSCYIHYLKPNVSLVSAGTPTGTVSAPTFTGNPLINHNHTLNGTGAITSGLVSAGTPSGIVSQPTFTGSPLGNHSHNINGSSLSIGNASAGTPAGIVSAPTFTGAPMGNHTHTASGGGGGGTFTEVVPGTDLSFLNAVKFRCYGIG